MIPAAGNNRLGTVLRYGLTSFAVMAMTLIVLEFASFGVYQLLCGQTFDRSVLLDRMQQVVNNNESWEKDVLPGQNQNDIQERFKLHPYVGFIGAGRHPEQRIQSPAAKNREDNPITIGIFGASVAGQTGRARDLLVRRLQETSFPGHRIKIEMFSIGGFKQPQQLMLLTYLLSLGLDLDILINIDGLNEVGYMAKKQALEEDYPHYPQLWNQLIRNNLTLPQIQSISSLARLRETQQKWAQIYLKTPILNRSVYALTLWDILNRGREQQFATEYLELTGTLSQRLSDESGDNKRHTTTFLNDSEMLADFAAVWKRSSLLMHQMCQENNIAYYHFLQPNQHVSGSKRFTGKEVKVAAINAGTPLEKLVRVGYPLLQKEGRELQNSGVMFRDLTGIFQDVTESIYIDRCCHMNVLGSQIMAQEIAEQIEDTCP